MRRLICVTHISIYLASCRSVCLCFFLSVLRALTVDEQIAGNSSPVFGVTCSTSVTPRLEPERFEGMVSSSSASSVRYACPGRTTVILGLCQKRDLPVSLYNLNANKVARRTLRAFPKPLFFFSPFPHACPPGVGALPGILVKGFPAEERLTCYQTSKLSLSLSACAGPQTQKVRPPQCASHNGMSTCAVLVRCTIHKSTTLPPSSPSKRQTSVSPVNAALATARLQDSRQVRHKNRAHVV